MSAAQLEKDYGISSKTNYFRYFQVRDFVKKSFSPSLELPQSGWIDELMDTDPTAKGTISTLYTHIQNVASPSLDNVRRKWEEELGLDISEVDWGGGCRSSTLCFYMCETRIDTVQGVAQTAFVKGETGKNVPGGRSDLPQM